MTPPDSGYGKELLRAMEAVKPDSDEREVRTMSNEEIADMHRDIQRWRAEGFVILTPLLAQRILAGLDVLAEETDDPERAAIIRALADELRAVIGK